MPAYQRPDWIAPTPYEFEERMINLSKRFPDLRRAELSSELRAHGGHAGYAAAVLGMRAKQGS